MAQEPREPREPREEDSGMYVRPTENWIWDIATGILNRDFTHIPMNGRVPWGLGFVDGYRNRDMTAFGANNDSYVSGYNAGIAHAPKGSGKRGGGQGFSCLAPVFREDKTEALAAYSRSFTERERQGQEPYDFPEFYAGFISGYNPEDRELRDIAEPGSAAFQAGYDAFLQRYRIAGSGRPIHFGFFQQRPSRQE